MAGELYLNIFLVSLLIHCYSSLKWTRSQLFLRSRMLIQNRRVNAWNAFVKAKLQDANDGNCFVYNLRIFSTDFVLRTREGGAH